MTRLALAAVLMALSVSSLEAQVRALATPIRNPEAASLDGKPLMIPVTIANQQKLEADLAQAEKTLAANPKDPEAMIWVGRRQGYLWRYNDAIAMFSKGIAMYPVEATGVRPSFMSRLEQAGVRPVWIKLADVGVHGNGHMMMLEKNNTEIAGRLHLSTSTVKTHVSGVLAKTRSRDRIQAALLASRAGLMPS